MTQLNLSGQRVIPYAGHKFRVKEIGGDYFFAVNKVSALSRTIEVMEYREGGDPSLMRKSPGQAKYEPITMERGVTNNAEFEQWANKVWNYGEGLGAEELGYDLGGHGRAGPAGGGLLVVEPVAAAGVGLVGLALFLRCLAEVLRDREHVITRTSHYESFTMSGAG